MNIPAPTVPVDDMPTVPTQLPVETAVDTDISAPELSIVDVSPTPVNPVRAAAGRIGGRRVHQLAELGREYEKEHGLTAGRQRLKQLIQLGRRYEQEHGLAAPKPRRRKSKGDAWTEFLVALSRVVKPAFRPAVEQLVAALRKPQTTERVAA